MVFVMILSIDIDRQTSQVLRTNFRMSGLRVLAVMDIMCKCFQVYINPYDFGRRKNWRLFLGLVRGRTWRHVLLPSPHKPIGGGLTWRTVHSDTEDDSEEEDDSNRREYIKDP
jgi:hypothetical protein